MLEIADEFYDLNNIQVNKLKLILLTSKDMYNIEHDIYKIKIKFSKKMINIIPAKKDELVCILDV